MGVGYVLGLVIVTIRKTLKNDQSAAPPGNRGEDGPQKMTTSRAYPQADCSDGPVEF